MEGFLETNPTVIDAFFANGRTRRQRAYFAFADGFIACCVLWPDLLSPAVWIPRLLGEVPTFKNDLKANVTMAMLTGRYIEIYRQLVQEPLAFAPKLPGYACDKSVASAWADGFIDALRAEPEPWRAFAEPVPHVALVVLAAMSSEPPRPEQGAAAPKREEMIADAPAVLTDVVLTTDVFWRTRKPRPNPEELGRVTIPLHVRSSPYENDPRVAEPAGRNDRCPCGSGKKYKTCCGTH